MKDIAGGRVILIKVVMLLPHFP
ncbi:MAG: hypothetical protein UZ02_AOB001000260, partial [Nitrosomonas europaea]